MTKIATGFAAAVLLASCDGASGSAHLTKREFIARADAICREANATIEGLGTPRTARELDDYIQKVESIDGEALQEIARLNPPKADEDKIDTAITKVQSALNLLNDYRQADLAGNKVAAILALQQANRAATDAQAIVREYGFHECGRVPNSVPE